MPSIKNKERGKPIEIGILIVLVAINCTGIIWLSMLPFADLPNHLAEGMIFKYRHVVDTPLFPAFSSALTWWRPSIAHIAICSLFPSVEAGNRLLYLLYVATLPTLGFLISRRCAGDRIISLLSILSLWNLNAIWGFTGFTLAIPLVVLLLYMEMGRSDKDGASIRYHVSLALLFTALYWMHALAFFFGALFYVLSVTCRFRRILSVSGAIRGIAPLLPVATMTLLWIMRGAEHAEYSTVRHLVDFYGNRYLPTLMLRVSSIFVLDGRAIAPGTPGMLIALGFSAFILVPTALCLGRTLLRKLPLTWPRLCTLVFAATGFLCFLLLPPGIPGQNNLHARFLVFALFGAAMTLTWALPAEQWRWFRYSALAVAAGYSLLWTHYFLQFSHIAQGLREVLDDPDYFRERVVGAVITDANYRGRPVLIHANNYQIVWNRGVAPTKLREYRFGAVRGGERTLPAYDEWIGSRLGANTATNAQILAHALRRYAACDAILTRGEAVDAFMRQRDDYHCRSRSGQWALYDKRNRL